VSRKNVEAIYPLSASQQGMLFEALCAPESGIHFEQLTFILHGNINISTFKQAWQAVVNRHSPLRTGFVWKDQDEPLQVVLRQVEVSLEYHDWRGISSDEQQKELKAYINAARRRGFELSKPPLMCPALFQIGEDTYQLVWTNHHILMDAWCRPILYKELLDFYQAFSEGKDLRLEPSRPYRDYITWLQQQDLSNAEAFWRKTLQGFTKPTPLGLKVAPSSFSEQEERYDEQSFCLPGPATAALQSLAKQHRLTLNTLVQGVWALLLSCYSREEDVVFGITVSGRPSKLAGIESMIGLFINTLPVRVKVLPKASLWTWLSAIQVYNVELRQYEYSPSGLVHQWSEVPGALLLYESILVFENHPVDLSALHSSNLTVKLDKRHSRFGGTPTKYPLNIIVFPGSELRFQIVYDKRRLDRADVAQILEHFLALLKSIISEPETELLKLLDKIPADQIPKVRPLQKFAQQGLEKVFVTPRTSLEELLAGIWAQVLGLEQVGIQENFFELGGHSLLATQLISRLREAFQVDLPLRSLFNEPTVAGMADCIERIRGTAKPLPLPTIVPNLEERHQPFPLTDIQQAYWIGRSEAFELSNVSTHLYVEIETVGLDVERFEKAWQQLIDRHEMLRALVQPDGQQQILEQVPAYEIKILDLRGQSPEIAACQLREIRERMSHQVLPADQWPLFEIRASQLNENQVRFHISFDLLIGDAWSVQILGRELAQLIQNPEISLPALELSFRDYVLSEIAGHNSETYRRSLEYWQHRLASLAPSPEFPLQKNLAAVKHPHFVGRSGKLEPDTWGRLKHRASQVGVTPSGLLLAAFAEILTLWSKSPRFTINLTLFNRLPLHPQVNQIVGDFTSSTLLAVDNSGQDTFEVRARRIQQQLWDDLEHRYVSGVQVLRELARIQERVSGALMPVVFTSTLIHETLSEQSSPIDWLGKVVYSISQTPQVYLDHQVSEVAGALVFNWDAVEELFPAGLLDDMFAAYCDFLKRLANSDELWHAMTRQLLPPAQMKQLAAINATEAPVADLGVQDLAPLLHTLFFDQVPLHPQKASVVTTHRTLTYQELCDRALQLGHQLQQLGARPNQLVTIVMEKGWEQVVAALGILASGAAYLPIDPGLPTERRWHLLEQGEVQWVLTQSWFDTSLEWPENVRRLCVDILEDAENAETRRHGDTGNFRGNLYASSKTVQQPEDLAYVIYTSGSTGLPKGVMIDHRGAVNTILDTNQRFNVQPQDRVLALSSLSFDLSVYDIFGTLAAGGTIVMPDADATRDPAHWAQLMVQHQVTIWNSVPALMQMLVDYAASRPELLTKSLRLVMLSGDWLPLTLPDQIRALFEDVQVVSLGGATEASIWSILYPIETVDSTWKSIPYGRPMASQRFYVLNEALEPCPVWVPGQLYIGGTGLARGYWRDEEKTSASFITHPQTKERLYKTGDLGRYLPDGNIEFLGREDFQVKVNGYRIELGEISAALQQHPAVKEVVVSAVGESRENKQLVAYVVPHQELVPTTQKLVEAYEPRQLEGVLLDPVERIEFKLKQPGLRQSKPTQLSIELPKLEFNEVLTQAYLQRQSYRQFLDKPIPLKQLGQLLSCLLQMKLDSSPLPKYRYPSAGSLYPVQTYLYIKPNRVEGLEAGFYYYHPADHRLVLLNAATEINSSVYGGNQPIFEQSAFSLFLIGQLSAIAPMYGELARDFCLLEAGYISQLLMDTAPENEIGLCPIGYLEFEELRDLFSLESSHVLLHSFVGGGIDSTWTKQLLQPKTSHKSESIADKLRKFLQQKLPDYMVPSMYMLLNALPLTPNGKVDRRALPALETSRPKLEKDFVAPRDILELQLTQIWEKLLDISPIGVTDNFFELGGDSLLAVRLMAQIQKQFGHNLPLSTLFQGATIEHLRSFLSQQINFQPSSPLVAIQPRGSNRPLFFVHPVGGNVLCYYELARHLEPNQPFYALQSLGLYGEREPYIRIEDMATHYIEALRFVQPEGPYLLGGWSMGGVVAFEMAQQLQKQEHEVALLALLDSPAPLPRNKSTDVYDYDNAKFLVNLATDMAHSAGKNLPMSYDHLWQLEPDEQLNYVLEQAQMANLMPPDVGLQQLRRLLQVFKSNVQAMLSYVPQVYPNRMLLFKASDSSELNHPTLGWDELSSEALEIITVPGDHYTMLGLPHIQILKERLKYYVDQVN
jgi:amino acid adenylation domain-containing protein